jgi:predicted aspartyl protease
MITAKEDNGVGRFSVEFDIANRTDMMDASRGLLAPEKVRRLTVSGIVDSGATRLMLPEAIVTQLGLPGAGEVKVRYADGRETTRNIVTDAYLELLGRSSVFSAVVEPNRRTALIGAFVLEELDFLVDCTQQRLVPRDPRYIISEIE